MPDGKQIAPEAVDASRVNQLESMVLPREGSDDWSVSPKGAIGKGQVMPQTAIPYLMPGVDPSDPKAQRIAKQQLLDPKVNAQVTRAYLSDLAKRYPGDNDAVLVAYNAGPAVADKWLASGKDPSVLPNETQRYVGEPLSAQWGKLTPEEQKMQDERTAATDESVRGLTGMMQQYAREAAQAEPGSKERDDLIAKYRTNLEQMQEEWRKKVASPPIEKPVDAWSNFGSAASVLGLLAGLLSRQHLTAGLNAAGSAMTAINNNNHEAFEQSYATWKTQTGLGLQMIGMENEDIRSLLEDKKMAVDEKNARLQTLATEMGFLKGVGGMQLNNIDAGMKFLTTREQMAIQMQGHQDSIQMHHDAVMLAHEDRMAALQARTGAAVLDSKTLGEMADQYLAGDKSVVTGLGYGNIGAQNRAALRTEIQKRASAAGMTGRDIATALAEYQGLTSGERSLGTRTATMGMAVSEAKQLIPQVLETSAKVPRTELPALNQIEQIAEKGTGDPDVVRFAIAVNSFINVYARAISPTGVPTVSDKDHARELLSPFWSSGQIQAGMDQILKELEAAAQAPGAVRQEFRESGQTGVSQPQIGFHGGAGGIAVPIDHAADPDGTQYRGSDGRTYVKRGGQMVPQ